MIRVILIIAAACGSVFSQVQYYPTKPTGDNVLVVFNTNYHIDSDTDGVDDGRQIARYYQAARNIPDENICSLSCRVGIDYNEELDSICSFLNKSNKIVYFDSNYPLSMVTRPDLIVDYFTSIGFSVEDASGLKLWMSDILISGKPESSLVIMSMGIVPDSVAAEASDSCLVRQYMDAGGTVVWIGDKQFFYQGHADSSYTEWGDSGSIKILGVRNAPNYFEYMGTVTDSGTKWGLKFPERAQKTVYLEDITTPLSICLFGDSTVCSWYRNYNPMYKKTGFVRYRSYIYYGDNVNRHKEISRSEYNQYIKSPLENYLDLKGVKEKIRYIVLTKGMPLKILQTNTQQYDFNAKSESIIDQSSLDAGVCLLYNDDYPLDNTIANPYAYQNSGRIERDWPRTFYDRVLKQRFKSFEYSNSDIVLSYLVTRLDGNNVVDIIGMIDRSSNPDTSGQSAIVLDSHSGAFTYGMYRAIDDARELWEADYNVVLDSSDIWVTNSPYSIIGYYSNGSHAGMPESYIIDTLEFNYAPGCIFFTHESYNCYSLEANSYYQGQGLLADFIHMGGTGAGGNVYEPFTIGLPYSKDLFRSYVMGYNLADAFYKSFLYVDWQNVIIGDPLCVIRNTNNVPLPPGRLNVISDSANINLTWYSNNQLFPQGYRLYKSSNNMIYNTLIEGISETSYVDTAVLPGNNYYYMVAGVDTGELESPLTENEFGTLDSVYFSDNFNRVSNEIIEWIEMSGIWQVYQNRLYGPGVPESYAIFDSVLSCYNMTIDILNFMPTLMIYLRWIDENNHLALYFPSNDTLQLESTLEGIEYNIFSKSINSINNDFNLNIININNHLKVLINNNGIVDTEYSCTIDNVCKGIGYRENRTVFDNLIVKKIDTTKVKIFHPKEHRIVDHKIKVFVSETIVHFVFYEGLCDISSINICNLQGNKVAQFSINSVKNSGDYLWYYKDIDPGIYSYFIVGKDNTMIGKLILVR